MDKFTTELTLRAIGEARLAWKTKRARFDYRVGRIMERLLHEAAINMMSVDQVAEFSGFTPKQVRKFMRAAGLEPSQGKRLLSASAAKALHENAALLKMEPNKIDLMSPLAYLPMGKELRALLETQDVVCSACGRPVPQGVQE